MNILYDIAVTVAVGIGLYLLEYVIRKYRSK